MEEIELTYLPNDLPKDVFASPHRDILDIYIPAVAEHPILRIRQSGDKYEMTKKEPVHGADSSHQLETTIPLSKGEFDELEKGIKGKRTLKTRYYYNENGVNYEVGIFKGPLLGLVLVDIEFKSRRYMETFRAPDWLLADVTQEKIFAGGMLCGKKYKDIEKQLKILGYIYQTF